MFHVKRDFQFKQRSQPNLKISPMVKIKKISRECRLFADTKAGKNFPQQIVGAKLTRDMRQRQLRKT